MKTCSSSYRNAAYHSCSTCSQLNNVHMLYISCDWPHVLLRWTNSGFLLKSSGTTTLMDTTKQSFICFRHAFHNTVYSSHTQWVAQIFCVKWQKKNNKFLFVYRLLWSHLLAQPAIICVWIGWGRWKDDWAPGAKVTKHLEITHFPPSISLPQRDFCLLRVRQIRWCHSVRSIKGGLDGGKWQLLGCLI